MFFFGVRDEPVERIKKNIAVDLLIDLGGDSAPAMYEEAANASRIRWSRGLILMLIIPLLFATSKL